MKRLVCVAIAALAVACGNRGTDARMGDAAQSGPQAQQGARSNAHAPEVSNSAGATPAADRQDQRVTLTGCLRGGEAAAGARSTAPTTGTTGAVNAAGQFTLANARPADQTPAGEAPSPRAGVGANGAGGSGGPLVSGVSTFLLSGSAPELQGHVNQQVRITGTIDARETVADAPRPGSRAAADTTPATSATPGSGTGTPPARHVAVESIQMIAARCQ